uniref:general transcription factor 3C polypeptide 4 isoform X3 n=1 Tax=Myxine glutinosa TaxID=7769 RepID=UPI00358FA64A
MEAAILRMRKCRCSPSDTSIGEQELDTMTDLWESPAPLELYGPTLLLRGDPIGSSSLAWSRDHRLVACVGNCVQVVNVGIGQQVGKQVPLRFSVTRSSIKDETPKLEMRSQKARKALARAVRPLSARLELALNWGFQPRPSAHGFAQACWSPATLGPSGTCLLALLALDGRLTLRSSTSPLSWTTIADLSSDLSREGPNNTAGKSCDKPGTDGGGSTNDGACDKTSDGVNLWDRWPGGEPPSPPPNGLLLDTVEKMKQHRAALTVVHLAWSPPFPVQRRRAGGSTHTVPVSLLSALTAVGDVFIWQGALTLKKAVVLWDKADGLPVSCLQTASLPYTADSVPAGSCSVVFAARGPHLLAAVLRGSVKKDGGRGELSLSVFHIPGLHPRPITSFTVTPSPQGPVIYTCADGHDKLAVVQPRLGTLSTDAALNFQRFPIALPGLSGRTRIRGVAASPGGAFLAVLVQQRDMLNLVAGKSHVNDTRLLFVQHIDAQQALKSILHPPPPIMPHCLMPGPLLPSPPCGPFNCLDLLEAVRPWIYTAGPLPPALRPGTAGEYDLIDDNDTHFLQLKLSIAQMLEHEGSAMAVQKQAPGDTENTATLRPGTMKRKTPDEVTDRDDRSHEASGGGKSKGVTGEHVEVLRLQLAFIRVRYIVQQLVIQGENHLGDPSTCTITNNIVSPKTSCTSLPSGSSEDFLSSGSGGLLSYARTGIPVASLYHYMNRVATDESTQRLMETFGERIESTEVEERCVACGLELPFSLHNFTTCSGGHTWPRCCLTFRACQGAVFRRCMHKDSIASVPTHTDPEWLQDILSHRCIYCNSPLL